MASISITDPFDGEPVPPPQAYVKTYVKRGGSARLTLIAARLKTSVVGPGGRLPRRGSARQIGLSRSGDAARHAVVGLNPRLARVVSSRARRFRSRWWNGSSSRVTAAGGGSTDRGSGSDERSAGGVWRVACRA